MRNVSADSLFRDRALSRTLLVCTDGACSGNPGPAGVGVVFIEDGKEIHSISEPIGNATNNIAEYTALIRGLEEAQKLQATHLKVRTDSELMFKQVRGDYKVKNEGIKPLHAKVMELLKNFKGVEMKAVPREENKRADQLATQSIRSLSTTVNTDNCPDNIFVIGEESPCSEG